MFIGFYTSDEGEQLAAVGNAIDEVISNLEDKTEYGINIKGIDFYRAEPIRVEVVFRVQDC
jgi:hypothetical protein